MIDIQRARRSAAVAMTVLLGCLGYGVAGAETLPQHGQDAHLGVQSCAGSTCHGATAPWQGSNVLQTEYVTWAQKDKHAQAYKVLLNDVSKRIAANLGIGPAHEAAVCLDCHADNVAADKRGRVFQLSDGVGCEACHGGGQRWLGQHIIGAYQRSENIAAGMYPTEDPVKRAELCLSCHFGDDRKFVTHRIMGAGHPRIGFELDTFTSIQPAHFVVDADYAKRKAVANGLQVWAIGQAMAVGKRLDALMDPKRGRDGLWPELVLFDCQACHHPLTELRWQPRPSTGLGPGVPRFDDSGLLMLQIVVRQLDADLGARLATETSALHKATGESWQALEAAAKALKATTGTLVDTFAKRKFSQADASGLLNGVLAAAKAGELSDYAGAEQAAMALSAILAAGDRMGLGDVAKAAKEPLDKAYGALAKYDGWDYAGFQAAMAAMPAGK